MKVLIVDNEIYLAESISAKLADKGCLTEILTTEQEALDSKKDYNIVLISANMEQKDKFFSIIEKYQDSIIIVLVSYIDNDTIAKAIDIGANDYILKPFMMEVLIRKIKNFQKLNYLREKYKNYEKFLSNNLQQENIGEKYFDKKPPIFIQAKFQKYADSFAFFYAKHHRKIFTFIQFEELKLVSQNSDRIYYIKDYQNLTVKEKKLLIKLISGLNIIISSTIPFEDLTIKSPFTIIRLKSDNTIFEEHEILKIADYIKYVVLNYQYDLPDTELSKKLGISRKSLWEKRKKFGIQKKKS
jgi:DNA-binding response OmpR family regulator